MKLYKYRSLDTWYDESKKVVTSGIDYCVDIINNYRLYFPKREQLNDPYEGNAISIDLGVCGNGIFSAMGCLHPIVEEEMNRYRILSFSSTCKSMPMWAHYAGNYNGVCFVFDIDRSFGNVQKVEYIETPLEGVSELDVPDFRKIVKKNFFYKSKNWNYEKEYRIVNKSSNEFWEFEPKYLTGIIVGFKALEQDEVKERIVDLARKKGIPLYKVFLAPRRYELSVIPIDKEIDWGLDVIENVAKDDMF